jgi:hypothetical protein
MVKYHVFVAVADERPTFVQSLRYTIEHYLRTHKSEFGYLISMASEHAITLDIFSVHNNEYIVLTRYLCEALWAEGYNIVTLSIKIM